MESYLLQSNVSTFIYTPLIKNLPIYDKYTLRNYNYEFIHNYVRNKIIVFPDQIIFATQLFKLYDELSESYYMNEYTLSDIGAKKAQEIIVKYKLDIRLSDVNMIRLHKVIDTYIHELYDLIHYNTYNTTQQSTIHVNNDDHKSRFLEPMIISNTYKRLSEQNEREFYQILLNYNEKNIPAYLKELYPEMKKQT